MSRSCRPPAAASAAVRQAHGSLSASIGTAVVLLSARAFSAEAVVLEDSWKKVLMAGRHVGWEHTVAVRHGETVTIRGEQYVRVGRYGAEIETRVTRTDVETASGIPVSFEQETRMSEHPQKLAGRIEDGKLTLSTTVMGKTRRVELEWKKGAVLAWGAELKIRPLLKSGGSTTFETFNPELGRFVEVEVEHLGREEVELSGGRRELHKLKVEGFIPGIVGYEYRDDAGGTWKMTTEALGISMETIRCGEREAKAIASGDWDIGLQFMIPSNVRFMQPRRVDEAVYELELGESDAELDFDGQEVIGREGGAVVLRVKAGMPREGAALPVEAPGMAKYLADTSVLQAGHPLIRKLAREAAEGEKDALRAAGALEGWVHKNIKFKGFGVGFASALEVAENRAGDCSEHAVLFCALARAVGIPSRAAAGIIYWEAMGSKPTFGYHMWTEVYVGEWVALDATLGMGRSDATHIKLSETAFEEGRGMGEIAEGLLKMLGNVRLKVKSYRVAGMRVVPGEAHTEWKVEGRRYVDLRNCFSLEAPKGWNVCLRGTGTMKKWDAAVELALPDGSPRIRVTSTRNPPSGRLKHVLWNLRRSVSVKEESRWMIDGEEAATVRYTKGGEERETVLVVDGDLRHVIRLSPWSPDGSRALEEVARSFRFVGKAGR